MKLVFEYELRISSLHQHYYTIDKPITLKCRYSATYRKLPQEYFRVGMEFNINTSTIKTPWCTYNLFVSS